LPCADGYVELLTLEQRQWQGLVQLLGHPEWANDPALDDSLERSRQGPELNLRIREWAASTAGRRHRRRGPGRGRAASQILYAVRGGPRRA
jgi:crotonobetainyl-CoA:carnitine CoA-transferase CaiB-like acyl-CoA transferase